MFRAPRPANLPGFVQVVQSLPATQRQIARHLDISERTLQRYMATDNAPRAAVLALFWESHWGRQCADVEASNWAALQYRRAEGLERTNATLRAHIERLEKDYASTGQAANSPVWYRA